jgi:Putative metallopeptidase
MAERPSDYEQLKPPKWQKKRRAIMQRAGFECEDCGHRNVTLHGHHSSDEKGHAPWEYPNESRRCFCEHCHTKTQERIGNANGRFTPRRMRRQGRSSAPGKRGLAVERFRTSARVACLSLLALGWLVGSSCGDDGGSHSKTTNGRVQITYDEAGTKPENLHALRIMQQSGAFERVASWVNARIALPSDIDVRVTDAVPTGVTDASAEADGKTVWFPPFFLTEYLQAAQASVADARKPSILSDAEFTPESLFAGVSEFTFGHEMGHVLIRVLDIPVTSFEESMADGLATFVTINNQESTYKPAVQAAVVFDQLVAMRGALKFDDFSSDHPIPEQRIFNFLCLTLGRDPEQLRAPLVDDGFVPESRAFLCPLEWAQLDHGWWRALEPHLTTAAKASTAAERQQAAANYKVRFAEFVRDFPQYRAQQAGGE